MPFRQYSLIGRYTSKEEEKREWWRTLAYAGLLGAIDCLWATCAGFAIYKLFEGYFIEPVERGYFCNDETIKYPYQPNTVSAKLLIITIIGSVPIFIAIMETLLFRLSQGTNLLPKWIRACTFEYFKFIIGFTISISVMEVLKAGFGKLRPHFLDVCKPDMTKVDCSIETNYVTNAYCTGDLEKIRDARSSFPSGHTVAVMFYAAYVLIYLYKTARAGYTRFIEFLAVMIGVLVVAWTLFVLVTRFTDRSHHLNDILFGSGLGIIFAFGTNALLTKRHVYEEREISRKIKFE